MTNTKTKNHTPQRNLRFSDTVWEEMQAASVLHFKRHPLRVGVKPSVARYLEHLHREDLKRREAVES